MGLADPFFSLQTGVNGHYSAALLMSVILILDQAGSSGSVPVGLSAGRGFEITVESGLIEPSGYRSAVCGQRFVARKEP